MEQENYELCDIAKEDVLLNRLNNEVQAIFELEISLPDYYDEKNLQRGVDKKWCGLLLKLT